MPPGYDETKHQITAAPAIATVTTTDADATFGAPEATLVNELKVKLNAALAALRAAGIIAS